MQSEGELLAHVRAAAEEFAATLAAGQASTKNWQGRDDSRRITHEALTACLHRLSASNCWGEANRLPSSELWRIAGPWLQHGELLSQARFKPRGYAGDYDLLGKICDDWRCEHPLGHALDEFFQLQAAPQAVRHRTQIVAREMVAASRQAWPKECHWVSVGAGPARDVESALQELTADERARVRVTLLDFDPLALEYAALRLRPLLSSHALRCARENLFRLPRNTRTQAHLVGANLISCVGFFDYLSQDDAASLLGTLWRGLVPGGRVVVFNFTPRNPSRALMEWVGNWYLIYRDAAQLTDLALAAGILPHQIEVGAEELGVDAFLAATTPFV